MTRSHTAAISFHKTMVAIQVAATQEVAIPWAAVDSVVDDAINARRVHGDHA